MKSSSDIILRILVTICLALLLPALLGIDVLSSTVTVINPGYRLFRDSSSSGVASGLDLEDSRDRGLYYASGATSGVGLSHLAYRVRMKEILERTGRTRVFGVDSNTAFPLPLPVDDDGQLSPF